MDSQTNGRGSRLAQSAARAVLPYPAGAQMAMIGVAAEASSQSSRWTLDTISRRVGVGVSLHSRMENDGVAGVGTHVWIGMVGWLRMMAFSWTDTGGRSGGFKSQNGTAEHFRPG